jgi:hypothetical protein
VCNVTNCKYYDSRGLIGIHLYKPSMHPKKKCYFLSMFLVVVVVRSIYPAMFHVFTLRCYRGGSRSRGGSREEEEEGRSEGNSISSSRSLLQ